LSGITYVKALFGEEDQLLTRLIERLHDAARDSLGATAVEYAIMIGFIAAVIVAGVTVFGTAVRGLFELWPGL